LNNPNIIPQQPICANNENKTHPDYQQQPVILFSLEQHHFIQ